MRFRALPVLIVAWCAASLPLHAAPQKARLVVVVVVDQLRLEDLEHYAPLLGPGGLGGLKTRALTLEGRYLTANTETAPGHATISTGTYTHEHGIVNNLMLTPSGPLPSVSDAAYPTWGRTVEKDGRSPLVLRVPTVGDQLKVQSGGRSRVLSVSGKDRSALMMAGYAADLALWWDVDQVAFVSSRYYAAEAPEWVQSFTDAHPPESFHNWRWDASVPLARYTSLTREDASAGEAVRYGMPNTLPKVLDPAVIPPGKLGQALRMTPRMDALVLELAGKAVEAYALGGDDDVDLLWVSLSGFDLTGHAYGPYSVERADALVKLSSELARFVAAVEKRVGKERVSWLLTADHGVSPIPEDSAARRIPSGRLAYERVAAAVDTSLDKQVAPRDWVKLISPPNIWLDAPAQAPLTCDAMDKAAKAAWEVPGVARAVATCKLEAMSGEPWDMLKRAWDPQRGGQILVEPKPYWVWTDPVEEGGTDHGTSWVFDQRVPVLVVAPGARLHSSVGDGPVDMRQVAPTIAALLGCTPPPAGRMAPLVVLKH